MIMQKHANSKQQTFYKVIYLPIRMTINLKADALNNRYFVIKLRLKAYISDEEMEEMELTPISNKTTRTLYKNQDAEEFIDSKANFKINK